MKYTLAQLKRDLKVGDTLVCLYHYKEDLHHYGNYKDKKRVIASKNTVGVKFENGIGLDYPLSAKLLEYNNDTFTIYDSGKIPCKYNPTYSSDKHKSSGGTFENPYTYSKQKKGMKYYTFRIVKTSLLNNN